MFKAVITTVVMALSEKQKNCSSDKTTTVCGDSSESLQLPTKPHSRGCESTYNKVLFTPPTMCRLTTRMSKRGSKVLRYALINAAHNVVKNNSTFKAYYDAKMAEGRTHYNALGHCAGKLVRVIWKMMTDDVEFNLD